ncbi:glycosyltransferase 87 family protein [Kitasatospora aureofaciens]|uniref:glycosyltransferase family 87 protein n=1 Tax=Kitasatospora aureofaciens TaxID=1894 RepID=UPI000526DEE4
MTSSDRDETAGPHGPGAAAGPTPAAVAMAAPPANTVVVPADEDRVAAAGSEVFGGPPGRRALLGVSWWIPVRVLALVVIVVSALGMVHDLPCYDQAWFQPGSPQYIHACYSDIPHLFSGRGFSAGLHPYVDRIPGTTGDLQYLEYPVLTGLFMQVAAWLTPGGGTEQSQEQWFWVINAGLLMACAVVAAVALSRTHRRRPWDAMLFALSPIVLLNGTVNWDLLAVALAAVAMAWWAHSRPGWAGVFIGLATAAKLYPLLLLGPLLVLCWRAGKWREFRAVLGGAVGAWLVVNLPIMLANWQGWSTFYVFSEHRGEDYGSFWLILMQNRGVGLADLDLYIGVLMVLGCAATAWLGLSAPRRPRFAQLAFLVVALFVLVNKVYSPQYALWLLPLAALARPRWRDILIWQACEVLYTLGIWSHLGFVTGPKQHGIGEPWYHFAIVLHLLGTLYLVVLVVRDALHPDRDPVRWDGSDDPSGGVLDRAPDAFTLGTARHLHEDESYAGYAPAGSFEQWLEEPRLSEPAGEQP